MATVRVLAGVTTTRLLTALDGLPPFTLYGQYAYADGNQGAGLGLTNLMSYTSGTQTGVNGMCRVWRAAVRGTTNGDELATTGTNVTRSYGLVTGFLQ